jgi:uncharacterized membrane protein YhaH (DUF805 family)/DNA-directed RNA polymerase subunit RPC12/RpoP
MGKEKKSLSDIRVVYCLNCYSPLSLNLSERRGENPIVCHKCNETFSLEEAKTFMEGISPTVKGKCPNCLDELDFYFEDRISKKLIECPTCGDKFYMSEVIPTDKERVGFIQGRKIAEGDNEQQYKDSKIKQGSQKGAFYFYIKAFQNYFDFHGRATRREYWSFFLIHMLIGISLYVLTALVSSDIYYISIIYTLLAFFPNLSILVRRLHDTDRSGWYILIAFIPIVGILVLLTLLVEDSYPKTNEYGKPKN